MNPYLMLGAALAIAGAYAGGRLDGRAMERGAQARAEVAAEKVRRQLQGQIDASATAGQTAELQRQSDVRSITREKETIIERPVYRSVCVDADGVGLLDRAAAVANGLGFTPPARAPPTLPQVARTPEGAMDGRQCLSSALDLYDVAGGIRGTLVELQREVGMRTSAPRSDRWYKHP